MITFIYFFISIYPILCRNKVDLCNKSSYQLHSIVDDESEHSCTTSSEKISRSNYSNLKSLNKQNENQIEKSVKFEAFTKTCPKPLKPFMQGIKSVLHNNKELIQSERTVEDGVSSHSKNESSGLVTVSKL